MNVAIHWMDKNFSSAMAIGYHYPDKKLMLCGIRKLQKQFKLFTHDENKSLRGEYSDVDTAKCHCPHHHKSGCVCISGQFITMAQRKFYRVLVDAGTKPENFATRMEILPGMSTNGKMGSVTSTPSCCVHVDSVVKVM